MQKWTPKFVQFEKDSSMLTCQTCAIMATQVGERTSRIQHSQRAASAALMSHSPVWHLQTSQLAAALSGGPVVWQVDRLVCHITILSTPNADMDAYVWVC